MVSVFYDDAVECTRVRRNSANSFKLYFSQGSDILRLFMDVKCLKELQNEIEAALHTIESDSVSINSMISHTGQ